MTYVSARKIKTITGVSNLRKFRNTRAKSGGIAWRDPRSWGGSTSAESKQVPGGGLI